MSIYRGELRNPFANERLNWFYGRVAKVRAQNVALADQIARHQLLGGHALVEVGRMLRRLERLREEGKRLLAGGYATQRLVRTIHGLEAWSGAWRVIAREVGVDPSSLSQVPADGD